MNQLKDIRTAVSEKQLFESAKSSVSLITKGHKTIITNRQIISANAGDLLYMPAGIHYIAPEPFEEIAIRFSPGELSHLLNTLSSNFGLHIDEHRPCSNCRDDKYAISPSWRAIRALFTSLTPYINGGTPNPAIEQLKKMELIVLLASNPDCCIQRRLLDDSDPHTENFETVIRDNLFRPLSLIELAQMTNRSPTAFKAEFRRRFHESPHAYITRQRLAHARMLLISTTNPVAEIGARCTFANPSHFIKLFGKEYGMTPAVYRKRHGSGN